MSNNAADVQYAGWHPSPTTRGTFNILQTCLSALFFCSYTALHLNVPWIYEKRRWKYLHQAKWILISIFFPEIILCAATTQLIRARRVQKHVNERYLKVHETHQPISTLAQHERSGKMTHLYDEKPLWQLQHSYFSVMNGYQLVHESSTVATDGEDSNLLQSSQKCMALQLAPECLIDLFFNTDFVPISLRELQDRSKASDLTRFVALFQTAYLVLQVIGRLASALPVTELEINTISHIMCAWVAWFLWFKKPYQIGFPQTVRLASTLGTRVACHWVLRKVNDVNRLLTAFDLPSEEVAVNREVKHDNDVAAKESRPSEALASAINTLRSALSAVVVLEGIQTTVSLAAHRHSPSAKFVVLVDHEISPQEHAVMVDIFKAAFEGNTPPILTIINHGSGSKADAREFPSTMVQGADWKSMHRKGLAIILANAWEFALQHRFWTDPGLQDETCNFEQMIRQQDAAAVAAPAAKTPKIFTSHCNMIDWSFFSGDMNLATPYLILLPVFIVYGGLQVALWNSRFPTLAESWLWRISALIVCVAPLCLAWSWNGVVFGENFLSLVCIIFRLAFIVGIFGPRLLAWLSRLLKPIHLVVSVLAILMFVLAQIFLVIDSFISLRSQPARAYEQVSWARYVPHI